MKILAVFSLTIMPVIMTMPAFAEEMPPFESVENKYPSMDSELAILYKDQLAGNQLARLDTTSGHESREVRVVLEMVDAGAPVPQSLGIKVEITYKNLVQAMVPVSNLEAIASDENVGFVRMPFMAESTSHGTGVVSEATHVMGTDLFNNMGYTGDRVKVAVIDSGFDIHNPEIVQNIAGYRSFDFGHGIKGDDTKHGTASAEVIVDIAPDVELYLYNFSTTVEFLNLVDYLIGRGDIDIVSASLIWSTSVGPADGTSSIAQKVTEARNSGILWVGSAGNYAERHWQGPFSDMNGNDWHNFQERDETISIHVEGGSTLGVTLSWWDSLFSNFDICLYENGARIKCTGGLPSLGSSYERIRYTPPYDTIVSVAIRGYTSGYADLQLWSTHKLNQYAVSESSIGIPADSPGSFTVGAANWSTGYLERYSSQGPTHDGRIKPDITGHTCVSTSVYDSYCGTSSSAPHVSGAAVLLMDAYSYATVDDIQGILEANTQNYHAKSNRDGTGMVDLTGLVPVPASALSVVVEPVTGSGVPGCQDKIGCYSPMIAKVDAGGAVIFSNTDNVAHTFTAGTVKNRQNDIFDSGLILPGSTFEYRANVVGAIPYFCAIHPWRDGIITVQETTKTKTVTLRIFAYDDSNGNGIRDVNEEPYPDIQILTYTPMNEDIYLLVTGLDGTISKTYQKSDSFYAIVLPPEGKIASTHSLILGDITYNGVLYVDNPQLGSTYSMNVGIK